MAEKERKEEKEGKRMEDVFLNTTAFVTQTCIKLVLHLLISLYMSRLLLRPLQSKARSVSFTRSIHTGEALSAIDAR